MQKLKGASHSYKMETNKNSPIIQSPLQKTKRLGYVSYSIGRSTNRIEFRQKVNSIKIKCFNKHNQPHNIIKPSKFHERQEQKNYTLGDEDMDISYLSSQEETDDAEIEQSQKNTTYLRKSRFSGRPFTIHFYYPKCCEIEEKEKQGIIKIPQITLKYRIYGSQYKCIINAFQSNGYNKGNSKDWDVFFDVRGSQIKRICPSIRNDQKFNHFGGCWYLGRKDKLWKGLQKLKKMFPQEYNFVPKTYIFPFDYDRFQFIRDQSEKDQLWIQKPVASACGRNIKILSKDSPIRKKKNVLVSEYISRPHLINHLKYDLRLYVLITSYNPLRIYLFQNGLVRFATEQYRKDQKHLKRKFVHLTNFSINKYSKKFIPNNNTDTTEKLSKWSLKALKAYYTREGIDYDKVFHDIEEVIIKTCISAEPNILAPKFRHEEKKSCYFQIYGFDILIDEKLKPWLLEVNVCPSLCSSSPLDRKIKHTLLTDTLNLIGIPYRGTEMVESPKGKEKQQKRKFKFKNAANIHNLCYENCVELLQPEDWLNILESEEELDRMGHFKRIFPLSSNIEKFQKYFEFSRYNNIVLWKYLMSERNFLHRIGL